MNLKEDLKHTDFLPYMNQSFQCPLESGETLNLELVEVSPLRFDPIPEEVASLRTPFSLVFRAPKDVYLPQKTYTLEHQELGNLQIFLVPVQPDETHTYYEAVFG